MSKRDHPLMNLCERCGEHIAQASKTCPRCVDSSTSSRRIGRRGRALTAALGVTLSLGVVACESTRSREMAEPVYGGPPVEEMSEDMSNTPEPPATPDMGAPQDTGPGVTPDMNVDNTPEVMPSPLYGGPPEE